MRFAKSTKFIAAIVALTVSMLGSPAAYAFGLAEDASARAIILNGLVSPTAPAQVESLTANAGASYNRVDLSWPIPGDGGSPITSYKVFSNGSLLFTLDSGYVNWPAPSDTTVSLGLDGFSKNTTYDFEVFAVNEIGTSLSANARAITVDANIAVEALPHGLVNSAYSQNVTINWTGFFGNEIAGFEASGLPAGLTFNSVCSEGCYFGIEGTPTIAGTFNATMTLTLIDGSQLAAPFTVVIDGPPVVPTVGGKLLKVNFAADSAKLTAKSTAALRKLVAYAHEKHLMQIAITGHTLKVASSKNSWRSRLGVMRAKAIAKYLHGLDSKLMLTVAGKGLVNKGRIATVELQGMSVA